MRSIEQSTVEHRTESVIAKCHELSLSLSLLFSSIEPICLLQSTKLEETLASVALSVMWNAKSSARTATMMTLSHAT